MFRIQSAIDPSCPDFIRQKEEYMKILSLYKERLKIAMGGGSEQAIKRHKERGKLSARERVDLLIDKNTPFIELSPMAAWALYNNEFPSARIVTGIGVIHGKKLIHEVSNNLTLKEAYDFTVRMIAEIRSSDEGQEGRNAFLEKRKPGWVNE